MRAIGGKDQQFGQRVDLLLHVEQSGTEPLPQRGPAWFSRSHDFQTAKTQLACQESQLRGFPATVNPFEGDESAGHVLQNCA
jgi:hypothetical protein